MSITVEDLKRKRSALARSVCDLVQAFEVDTGVKICNDIRLTRVRSVGGLSQITNAAVIILISDAGVTT